MPDPSFEGGGMQLTGPGPDVPKAKLREADEACKKYAPEEVEGPELSEEQQQEFKEAALANARCMREHGIENFPDPTIDADGRVTTRMDKNSGIDVEDPEFREAEKACRDTEPKPPSEESSP